MRRFLVVVAAAVLLLVVGVGGASPRLIVIPLSPIRAAVQRFAAATAVASTFLTIHPSPSSSADASSLVQQGMAMFRAGDVAGSVAAFDAAVAKTPALRGVLWQRGLSLYYADRFDDCSQQFRGDVALNPRDAEEIVWTVLCDAQKTKDFAAASAGMPNVPDERRPIMREVLALFRGTSTPEALQRAGDAGGKDSASYFYARLYLGLYYEAQGDKARAAAYVADAVGSGYARRSGGGDYMVALAKVYQQQRR